jgi:hypothetical protein
MPIIATTAVHGGTVTVIHGRGVDAVFVFPAEPRSGALSALVAGTASAPSSSSASSTTPGGLSWSCVHSPLKLFDRLLLQKNSESCSTRRINIRTARAEIPPGRTPYDLRGYGLRLGTLWNEPQLLKQTASRMKISITVSVFRYRIRRRRLGTAGAEGLRGNEAQFMRTSLWYSHRPNRASPIQ